MYRNIVAIGNDLVFRGASAAPTIRGGWDDDCGGVKYPLPRTYLRKVFTVLSLGLDFEV